MNKQGHTISKAKQHNTPKAVTFSKRVELHQVGYEPTTLRMHVHCKQIHVFSSIDTSRLWDYMYIHVQFIMRQLVYM